MDATLHKAELSLRARHRSQAQPTDVPDLAGVPALTLLNPWAAAVLMMDKRIENRRWMPGKARRRFMVHAGQGRDPLGLAKLEPYKATLDMVQPGTIIAVVDIKHVCARQVMGQGCGCGWWAADGQYHWALGQIWALANPVPARGRQKFWQPGPDLAEQVQAQIAAAAPLTCGGRPPGGGRRCGARLDRPVGLTQYEYETHARTAGWRFGVLPKGDRTAMCPPCAAPNGGY